MYSDWSELIFQTALPDRIRPSENVLVGFDKCSHLIGIGQCAARGFFIDAFGEACEDFAGAAFGGFSDAFGDKCVDGFCPAYRAVQLAYQGIFDFVSIIIRGNIGVMNDADLRLFDGDVFQCFGKFFRCLFPFPHIAAS